MKRHFEDMADEGFRVQSQESKLRFTLGSLKNTIGGLSASDIVSRLEPFIRGVVRDEVDRAVTCFHDSPLQRPSLNPVNECGLQLRFVGKLPQTIFTAGKIVSEDSSPLKIELIDGRTKRIVTVGALSSIKIEVLVLDGDFGCDEQENWTEKDFDANIVREREGKRPLLTGELSLYLRGGIGVLGEINFTDNSSWIRSRKFRLGARSIHKFSAEGRIKEARSNTFVVKDHRGELYKKHHPPNLGDEVWRLEKISKEGAFHSRLSASGIKTVKDFLQLNETDPTSLRNILGPGIPNRTWEAIVEHATTCIIDDNKFYGYYQAQQQKVGLLFNSVYKVVGATFDGHNYLPLDKLSFPQTLLVQSMKKQALKNLNELFPIDAHSTITPPRALTNFQTEQLCQSVYLQPLDLTLPQGQLETIRCFSHSSAYTPSISGSATNLQSLESSASQNPHHHQVQVLGPASRNSSMMIEDVWSHPASEENSYASSEQGPSVANDDDIQHQENFFQVQTPNWFP